MKFAYTAYDKAGKTVTGTTDAASSIEAGESLRKQGLFATEIMETSETPTGHGSRSKRGGGSRTKRLKAMAAFVRQLSVLVSTGTPIVEAINSLERQIPAGHWRVSVGDMRARIEQGASLSAALEHHPSYFDGVARSLIAAGESGGMLDAMLKRLSNLARQQVRVRAMITGAMVYPCLLITVAVTVLGVMLFFVLPRFEGLFKSLGSGLPPTTQMLIDLSNLLRDYWWIALPLIIIAAVGAKLWAGSAYDHYAVKAIKFSALDYLLKPIDIDDLTKAVEKVEQKIKSKPADISQQMQAFFSNLKNKEANKKIGIPSAEGIVFVNIADIVRCESDVNYTHIYLTNKTKLTVPKTLKEYEDLLTEYNFFRIHNSALINLDHVKEYQKTNGGFVIMSDGKEVEISRRKKAEFLEKIGQ